MAKKCESVDEKNKNSSENADKRQGDETKYVIFVVNNEEYAIELVNVKEIIRIPKIKKVPNSVYVEGVFNLRGELVTIIDIHKRYNISKSEYKDNSRVIVMEFGGCIVGIIVDKVLQVLAVHKSYIKLICENTDDTKEGYIDGIIMIENGKRLIMIMDAQSIININGLGSILVNAYKKSNEKVSAFIKDIEENEQLIIFSINDVEYAFHISEIKEVIRIPNVVKVPNSSDFIEGIISLRNELIGVVNLAKIINIDSESISKDRSILIVNTGNLIYGVIVDKVSEVKLVSKKDLLKPWQVVGNIDVKIVKEFANMDNGKRVVTILDPYNILNLEEIQWNFKVNEITEIVSNNYNKSTLDLKKIIKSIVIFKIENEEYGISIDFVQEINTINKITSFPNRQNAVEGLINLRGDMIPLINLRTLFGLEIQSKDSYFKTLIVKINNKKVGIRIDSASEVLNLSEDIFQDYFEDLNADNNRRYVEGIIKPNDGKRIILYLNINEILDFI
ncbi:chemotaxis protein CheW [Clostridium saccharobutylicum]|uniref:chemotaxis protein CheW n=1 Tax=Clostridium saccharobutylicum TaxID=169679 RepID=UPI001494FD71|nr:purine-binding chemotaxis protein CheW [Clostridium saccharobutylicum]